MALKPGTVADYDGSMAKAIENAMRQEWPNVMGAGTSFDSNPQLKLLCVAVAQGVIRYLRDNPASFKVTVSGTAGEGGTFTSTGEVKTIETAGTVYGGAI